MYLFSFSAKSGLGVQTAFGNACRQVLLTMQMGGFLLPRDVQPPGVKVASQKGPRDVLKVAQRGVMVLRDPVLNKGTNFSEGGRG